MNIKKYNETNRNQRNNSQVFYFYFQNSTCEHRVEPYGCAGFLDSLKITALRPSLNLREPYEKYGTSFIYFLKKNSLATGFEPARAEHIAFRVQLLNHSDKPASRVIGVSTQF